MRENEFEKQVQQKMDDFNIRPSAEVWTAVERRIRKEKKRRFIFWWPLLFVLVAGGIGTTVLLINNNNKSDETAIAKTEVSKKTETAPSNKITEEDKANDKIIKNALVQGNTTAVKNRNQTSATQDKKNLVPSINSKFITTELAGVKNKKARQQAQAPVVTGSEIKNKIEQPTVSINATTADETKTEKTTGTIDSLTLVNNETNSLLDSASNKKPVSIANQLTDTAAKNNASKNKKKSKWEWEISAAAGRSSVVDALSVGLFKSAEAFDVNAFGGQAAVSFDPAVTSFSGSWHAGVQAKKDISKKLQLRLGIGYSYLSSKMTIGSRIDSGRLVNNSSSSNLFVANYYRPSGISGSQVYYNRYHFINLSADLSWQIINGKKFKLYWKNGLAYGRLFGSTMLHADISLPGYYADNNLLQKNQLFIFTGLSAPVYQRLWLNPYLKYSITGVLKNKTSANTHFGEFGLQVSYLLRKK
jgi:hypothetical protein